MRAVFQFGLPASAVIPSRAAVVAAAAASIMMASAPSAAVAAMLAVAFTAFAVIAFTPGGRAHRLGIAQALFLHRGLAA